VTVTADIPQAQSSSEPLVVIVLSTYNGERYLPVQLKSIFSQTFRPWRLLIRDDGSTDATPQLIEDATRRDPQRIRILADHNGNLGTVASYSRLVEGAAADYVLFSDQDDCWLPDKVSRTLAAMRTAEQVHGTETPLLVHTDLQVVDQALKPLAASFWRYRRLDPLAGVRLPRLLTHNVATGCTMMINRPLVELAAPFPQAAVIHDWWLALVATLFGRIVVVDQATILYRQHGDNSIGASRWGWRRILEQVRSPHVLQAGLLLGMRQAGALLERYRERMRPEHVATVAAYAALPFVGPWCRIKTLRHFRFCKHGFVRTAGFVLNVLMLQKRGMPPLAPVDLNKDR